MKRILMIVLVALTLGFISCQKDESVKPEDPQEPAPEPTECNCGIVKGYKISIYMDENHNDVYQYRLALQTECSGVIDTVLVPPDAYADNASLGSYYCLPDVKNEFKVTSSIEMDYYGYPTIIGTILPTVGDVPLDFRPIYFFKEIGNVQYFMDADTVYDTYFNRSYYNPNGNSWSDFMFESVEWAPVYHQAYAISNNNDTLYGEKVIYYAR